MAPSGKNSMADTSDARRREACEAARLVVLVAVLSGVEEDAQAVAQLAEHVLPLARPAREPRRLEHDGRDDGSQGRQSTK